MIPNKYREQLSQDEIDFFEKIFEDEEVKEFLKILKKKRFWYIFNVLLLLSVFFVTLYIATGGNLNIIFLVSFVIIYISFGLYFVFKIKFLSGFDKDFPQDIIRYKIFEKFFKNNDNTYIAEPNKDEYFVLYGQDENLEIQNIDIIKEGIIESGKYQGMKKVFPAEIITEINTRKKNPVSGMILRSRKSPRKTIIIATSIALFFSYDFLKNGFLYGFDKDILILLSAPWGIAIAIIIVKILLNWPTQGIHQEVEKFFQINYLNLNFKNMRTIVGNKDFGKNDDLELIDATQALLNQTENNLQKFFSDKNIESLKIIKNLNKHNIILYCTENGLKIERKVYKLPYFCDPTSMIHTNMTRYIDYYIEMRELIKIAKSF